MDIGLNELHRQLCDLGYSSSVVNNQFVVFNYKIPTGRFIDQEVEIALEAPQFPLNPPSGPYIKPHIMPITGGGGEHPNGGIHKRDMPTSEFQYWSRPFSNWNNSEKNAKEYLAFIRTLFDFQ
ncbi:MAG TPA: E2/UBC family protein [Prolixibacteraceae bacterium]|jgi:hypothetical protein